jgi:hypothetical protein
VKELTTSRKGAAAEVEIAAALIRLGLVVLWPMCEGGRYDLVVDTGERMLRIQCKWASRKGGVLTARCVTSRHTPGGYRKTTYSAAEVDALALYSPATDACYLIPIEEAAGRKTISLRLAAALNHQGAGIHWARDYELARALEHNWSNKSDSASLVEDATAPAVG